ncbi:MAG: sulfite exporter TauE/SafE family protein [Variibacter sp.]|nr:sulfite exporter TauE/SafE family protein [Variibacter sp.]
MIGDYIVLAAIGFVAQCVDGALGMAFGVISNSALLTMGIAPAQASAIVHTAEVFTTAGSAVSHLYHRNVDWRLVWRLGVPGVLGAILGATVLSNVDSRIGRPVIAVYLLIMGVLILLRATRTLTPREAPAKWTPALGLGGGFLDASGGGGWGPLVTSTLIGSGHAARTTIGSVNATEFFVTVAAATTFFIELGASPIYQLTPLVIGGLLAAPLGGWMAKHARPRLLMALVGLLVIGLSVWQLVRLLGPA